MFFTHKDGNPDEQRTFRVVVSDLSRCTLGEIYFDGKLNCGTNFRVAAPLNVEKKKINTFAVYPNLTPNKKFKLLISNDNLNNYKISIRNLGGVIVLTRTINIQKNFPLEIDLHVIIVDIMIVRKLNIQIQNNRSRGK